MISFLNSRPKEQPSRQTHLGKPPLRERIWQAKDNGCRGEQGDAADCEPGRKQHRGGINCDPRRMQAHDETDRARRYSLGNDARARTRVEAPVYRKKAVAAA